MEIINELHKYSFQQIKEICQVIFDENSHDSLEVSKIIESLCSDKRKNVVSLGLKYKKSMEAVKDEIKRVRKMYDFDKSFGDYGFIAGVDEVGRGPLAGPIVACAVILDLNVQDDELILYLNDSKKIKENKRKELAEIIKKKALAYNISECSNEEIDEKGIAYCNNKVFLDSCNGLKVKPQLVLSDGYPVKNIKICNEAVIKGDTKSAVIAAASIIAKDYRDNIMKKYAEKYPEYNFEENVGYGTRKHIETLKSHGITPIHRRSFLTKIYK